MTEDSICKDCVSRRCITYQLKGVEGDPLAVEQQRTCKKMVAGEMAGDVKVLECSEYEHVKKVKRGPSGVPLT